MAYEADTTAETGEKTRFIELSGWVREDRRARSDWYKECDIDFGFYAGGDQQWKEADRQHYDEAQSVYTTFNFVQPSVSAVNGMEVSNRQQVKFLPRTTQTPSAPVAQQSGMPGVPQAGGLLGGMGGGGAGADDQGPAETLSAANDYLRDQSDAEDEESDAFQDCAICGMGWTETRVDYDEDPKGRLAIDRCDPGEMGWDGQSTKRNLSDARRLHRVRNVDQGAAKTMFPEYEISEIDAAWARNVKNDTNTHDQDAAKYYENNQTRDEYAKKSVTLVEITWYDTETKFRVASTETGEVLNDQTKEQVAELRKRAKKMGMQIAVQAIQHRIYKYAFLGATKILGDSQEGELCQSQKGFKFKAITGWRDRNKKQWMGIVRAMRDPQKWANALYSSTLNTVMTSGKGIMAERSAFEKPENAEADWAKSGNIVWLNTGALSGQNPKVMQKVPTPLPPGIEKMMEFAISAMRGVSGVNLETLGGVDRDQAASLEYQRRQAATTILAPFFDGLRKYRKEQGRISMDLIKQYLSDGRLIRIVGPDYEKYVPLLKQDDTLEYDIVVSESPTSPNQKEASWATIQQMLPVVGKNLGPKTMGVLMKASPLPEDVVSEFKDAVEQEQQAAAQQPNPDMLKLQGEMQLKQVDAQQNERKAEQEMMLAQQKAQQDLQLGQIQIQLKAMELQLAQFQAGADLQMREQEMGFKQKEMGFKQQEAESKAKEGEAQRKHESKMRRMEIPGALEMDEDMNTKEVTAAIERSSQATADGNKALADAIKMLAQAMSAPRVTEMPDPVTGQTMRAVSTVQNQMVN